VAVFVSATRLQLPPHLTHFAFIYFGFFIFFLFSWAELGDLRVTLRLLPGCLAAGSTAASSNAAAAAKIDRPPPDPCCSAPPGPSSFQFFSFQFFSSSIWARCRFDRSSMARVFRL